MDMPKLPSMIFNGRLFVVSAARDAIAMEAGSFRFRETGGVIFGYRTSDDDVVLTEVTGPGPRACHGFRSFRPDTRYCQARLAETYQQSNGAITYQGEWHTHPHGLTSPSRLDMKSMMRLATDPDVRQPTPILWVFRPADEVLGMRWQEEHSVFLLDAPSKKWRPIRINWLAAVPR